MNRRIWRERYLKNGFPAFPCPRCGTGALRVIEDTLMTAYDPVRDDDHYDRGRRPSVTPQATGRPCARGGLGRNTARPSVRCKRGFQFPRDDQNRRVPWSYSAILSILVS